MIIAKSWLPNCAESANMTRMGRGGHWCLPGDEEEEEGAR